MYHFGYVFHIMLQFTEPYPSNLGSAHYKAIPNPYAVEVTGWDFTTGLPDFNPI